MQERHMISARAVSLSRHEEMGPRELAPVAYIFMAWQKANWSSE